MHILRMEEKFKQIQQPNERAKIKFNFMHTFCILKVVDTELMTYSRSMTHKIVWTQIAV